jgi:hypothetical protein
MNTGDDIEDEEQTLVKMSKSHWSVGKSKRENGKVKMMMIFSFIWIKSITKRKMWDFESREDMLYQNGYSSKKSHIK